MEHWLTQSRRGRITIENEPRDPRPSLHRTEEQLAILKECLADTKSWSVWELSFKLEIPKTTIHRMLRQDLGLTKRLAKWVPHVLSEEQKKCRITVARVNLERPARKRNLFGRLVAIDESWVALYSPPARDQMRFWLEPEAAAPNVPLPELHERNHLMIMAMDLDGVAFFSFLEENETLTSEKYCDFLNEHMEVWCQKKNVRKPIILHDNARPHKAHVVRELIEKKGWSLLEHSPYSLDMNPCDYNGFGQIKRRIKGTRYTGFVELKSSCKEVISDLNGRGALTGLRNLPKIWRTFIDNNGDY